MKLVLGTIARVVYYGVTALDVAQSIRSLFGGDKGEEEDETDDVEDTDMIGTGLFPRSLQKDDYSCGARAVYMIAKYFRLPHRYKEVKKAVGTTEDSGTSVKPMIRFFREHQLKTNHQPQMRFRDLRRALKNGAVVLVYLDGDHYGVVHAVTSEFVYLADPSLVRQLGRRTSKRVFKKRWKNWGITVRA